MSHRRRVIMKFGGASLSEAESFARVADLALERRKYYQDVVIVVSAMGETTDQLLTLAKQIHPDPPRRELDMLITVGERISMSLLAMAFAAKGCEAVSFTGSQSGIITCTTHNEARIQDVKPRRVVEVLESGKIAIVAGFQGVSQKGEITTLGRGGSDTSAVALAIALSADKVEFYKDVEGIYDSDPKSSPHAKLCPRLTFDEALLISGKSHPVLHPRSLELAKKYQLPLTVRSFVKNGEGTEILGQGPRTYLTSSYE